jgi:hypothetical protein
MLFKARDCERVRASPFKTMNGRIPLRVLVLAAGLGCPAAHSGPIQHEFIAVDEGLGNLLYVNELDPKRNWIVPIGHSRPRDLQLIGAGRLLLSHEKGYAEFDLSNGRREFDLASYSNVSSARRLPNGDTLLAYAVEGKPMGVFVAELSPQGREVRVTAYPGDYVRLMRQTDRNTFLFGMNDKIGEGDGNGAFVWTAKAEGFRHAWKALRLPNGDTLASGGYGAFMVEFAPDGRIVRRFGGAADVPAEVHPYFYGTFQLLADGDVVVANWQGHGPGHGASGIQLLEFDAAGGIVWRWSDRSIISSVQGVLVLDGLDTARLYDERAGLMLPVGAAP